MSKTALKVFSEYKLHQRVYSRTNILSRAKIGLVADSWIWLAITQYAYESSIQPKHNSEAISVIETFSSLKKHTETFALAQTPLPQLTSKNVVQFFQLMEDHVIQQNEGISKNSQSTRSMHARKIIKHFLKAENFTGIDKINRDFRSSIKRTTRRHGDLISDEPESPTQYPLGALPHGNIEELKAKTRETLVGPIDKIKDACLDVIKSVDLLGSTLANYKNRPIDANTCERLAKIKYGAVLKWASEIPIDDLIAAYARIIQTSDHDTRAISIQRAEEIQLRLEEVTGRTLPTRAIWYPLLGLDVLLVFKILIQIHTAWNGNVVLELTTLGIKGELPPLEIQSYKTRVNKSSSVVFVERRDTSMIFVIDFLKKRLSALKKAKWVDNDETRLWISEIKAKQGNPIAFVGWDSRLKRFRKDFDLPKFNFKTLRTQLLCLIDLDGGIEGMRHAANHQSIKTTGLYANQVLLTRYHEAINLEYQRRLEKEIIYLAENTQERASQIKLLHPIGDGTLCSSPANPPSVEMLSKGVCMATNCHSEGGCQNRRIIINNDRITEIALTLKYYKNNWRKLLEENRDGYISIHFPAMIFNRCLSEVIKKGPYGHILKAAVREI